MEPRDLLGSRWLCGAMLAAAERAGFACVEERRRRLDGVCRPDWEVDVYAFALRGCGESERVARPRESEGTHTRDRSLLSETE